MYPIGKILRRREKQPNKRNTTITIPKKNTMKIIALIVIVITTVRVKMRVVTLAIIMLIVKNTIAMEVAIVMKIAIASTRYHQSTLQIIQNIQSLKVTSCVD